MSGGWVHDRHVLFSPICFYCVHAEGHGQQQCAAFLDGIPGEIWEGQNDHRRPYAGDDGITFRLPIQRSRRRRNERGVNRPIEKERSDECGKPRPCRQRRTMILTRERDEETKN